MTEDELIQQYADHTVDRAKQAIRDGIAPMHVANVLFLASCRLAIDLNGVQATRNGLMQAYDDLAAQVETVQ